MMSPTNSPLSGRWLALGRAAWLLCVGLGLGLLALGLPLHGAQWATVCSGATCGVGQLTAQQAQELPQIGLSIASWATTMTFLWNVSPLVSVLVAALIVWRKSDDRMALFVAFVLAVSGIGSSLDYQIASPVLQGLVNSYSTAGSLLPVLLLFVFPDGKFVPAWTRWLLPLAVAVPLLSFIFTDITILSVAAAGVWLMLVLLQIYRYRRASNAVQRQQTKWVVYGLAVALSVQEVTSLAFTLIPSLQTGSPAVVLLAFVVITLCLVLIPFSVAMAILRSHLWDIDLLIRRTLIYTALTALLALVYFGCVLVLQGVFTALTGQQRSELVTVISTLAIAALFVPLRSRLQALIDRRFYRSKYDTARTLADFSLQVRDQVDLDRLTDELVNVVQETMQPAQVSLWLIGATKDPKGLKDL